jgi:hypothetical protein
MYWENDNMNFADACKISNDFYIKMVSGKMHFGISMFNFGDHDIGGIKTRKEMLDISFLTQPPHTSDVEAEYRRKKLNK